MHSILVRGGWENNIYLLRVVNAAARLMIERIAVESVESEEKWLLHTIALTHSLELPKRSGEKQIRKKTTCCQHEIGVFLLFASSLCAAMIVVVVVVVVPLIIQ